MRSLLAVCLLAGLAVAAGRTTSTKVMHAAMWSMQPIEAVSGSGISYTDSTWRVEDNKGETATAKGFYVNSDVDTGHVTVHLIGNQDSAGAKVYTTIYVVSQDNFGAVFDEIHQRNTTIPLADLLIWISEVK